MTKNIFIYILIALTAQISNASHPALKPSTNAFQQLHSYSTTLQSYGNAKHQIQYRYMKPGFVRMDFITPHKGAALVYRPDTKMVQLRPFGFSDSLILTLSPTSKLVRSPSGHLVNESDIGALLKKVDKLANSGSVHTHSDNRYTLITVTGQQPATMNKIHIYKLWINPKTLLPEIVEAYDHQNNLLEGLILKNTTIDPAFDIIFQLK